MTLSNGEKKKLDTYELKMFLNNNFDIIVPVSVVLIDDIRHYNYDVSDYKSLQEIYEKVCITKKELKGFIYSLQQLVKSFKECLISVDSILLSVDKVYVRNGKFYFCYYGDNEFSFQEGLGNILEFFLNRVDYTDKEAVVYAYKIYQQIVRDGASIEVLEDSSKVKETVTIENDTNQKKFERRNDETLKEQAETKKQNTLNDNIKNIVFGVMVVVIILVFLLQEKFGISVPWQGALLGCVACIACIYFMYKKKEKIIVEGEKYDEEYTRLLTAEDRQVYLVYDDKGTEKKSIINHSPFLIGSQSERVELCISNKSISRIHARIFSEGNKYFIEDMESTNGTCVNDRRLRPHEVIELEDTDVITLADYELLFRK